LAIALIIGAVIIDRKPDLIQVGLEAVFLGGLARLFSFTEFGFMSEFVPAIAIELGAPLILFVLL
jgi:hypothetical protein